MGPDEDGPASPFPAPWDDEDGDYEYSGTHESVTARMKA